MGPHPLRFGPSRHGDGRRSHGNPNTGPGLRSPFRRGDASHGSPPLDHAARDLLVQLHPDCDGARLRLRRLRAHLLQTADVGAAFRWEHTTFSIDENVSYGVRNFRAMAIAPPIGLAPALRARAHSRPAEAPPRRRPAEAPRRPPGRRHGTPARSRLRARRRSFASSIRASPWPRRIRRPRSGKDSRGARRVRSSAGTNTAVVSAPSRKRSSLSARGPTVTLSLRQIASPADDFTTVADGTSLETGSTMRAQIVDVGEQ